MCDQFPTLYAMAASKGAKVGEVWDTTRGEGGWNLRFIKPFNDWEMEEIQRLINLISSKNIFFFGRQEAIILAKQDKTQGYIRCIQEKQKDYLPPTNLGKLQDAH